MAEDRDRKENKNVEHCRCGLGSAYILSIPPTVTRDS